MVFANALQLQLHREPNIAQNKNFTSRLPGKLFASKLFLLYRQTTGPNVNSTHIFVWNFLLLHSLSLAVFLSLFDNHINSCSFLPNNLKLSTQIPETITLLPRKQKNLMSFRHDFQDSLVIFFFVKLMHLIIKYYKIKL